MPTLSIAHTWDGHALPPDQHATVSLEPIDGDALRLRVDAPDHGDPPPDTPPGPTLGLWNHEVVELFIAGEGRAYVEIELGPGGHHLVLQLEDVRRPSAQGLPLDVRASRSGGRWRAEARVPAAWLPPGPHRANAYRIHGVGEARRYLAHAPVPGPAPDFHQPDRFVPFDVGSCTLCGQTPRGPG